MLPASSKQIEITKKFLSQATQEPKYSQPIRFVWWRNTTNSNSMRLTKTGYEWTQKFANVKYHKVELSHGIVGKHLLQLERLLQDPYYITGKHIFVYSEQDAIMLQLHAGNLGQYLDNLQSNT